MERELIFGVGPQKAPAADVSSKQAAEKLPSFAAPTSEDGSYQFASNSTAGLSQGFALNLDAGVASEAELIEKYRTMALYPECDMAIGEISDAAIVQDDTEPAIAMDLSEIDEVGDATKKQLQECFDDVASLMDFKRKGHDIFKRWYVDSRIAYHKIVDPQRAADGIVDLRFLDPRKIKKIKEVEEIKIDKAKGSTAYRVKDEYYLYIESATSYNKTFAGQLFGDATYNANAVPGGKGVLKIRTEAVAFCHSGQIDGTSGVVYGHLQKAIKPFNQLRMLEDSLVIYRLARAPERRIFYVDTGSLPPQKAEHYVRQLQNRYRTKVVYDPRTGDVADQRRTLSMQDDYWIPRREGGKGTEISTLPGGQNLGDIADVVYFKDKFWNSLNVPTSRFKEDGGGLLGPSAEISREELKFGKFIGRLRSQFSQIFLDILKTHAILKRVVDEEDWNLIAEKIKFKFARDSHYAEMRDAEIIQKRLSTLAELQPFIGKFYSKEWVQKTILMMTDDQIKDMQKQIDDEIKSGAWVLFDPNGEPQAP